MAMTHFQQTNHDVEATELYCLVVTVGGDHCRAIYDDTVPLFELVDTRDYKAEYAADPQLTPG